MHLTPVPRLTLVAQAMGLAATTWLVWHYSLVHRIEQQTAASVIGSALLYILLAWSCSAIVTFYIYLIVSQLEPIDAIRASARSSAAGMWLAPAIILLSELSPVALITSLLLVVNTTRLLIWRWTRIGSSITPPRLARGRLPVGAIGIETAFVSWRTFPALTGALAIQPQSVLLYRNQSAFLECA